MPNSVVLDSHALLVFLKRESGHDVVGDLFHRAADEEVSLGVCVVNLGEVWYQVARGYSTQVADEKVLELKNLGLQVVDIDWSLTRQAAVYKAQGGLSFADCYAAALAKAWNTALVTGDPEFKRVEKEVEIQWIGKK
jgi:predicted nucleic acid-binding protein